MKWYRVLCYYATVCILLLITIGSCRQQDPIRITDAWIRAVPPSRDVTGAYMVIENLSPKDNALVAVETSMADTVEIHEMTYVNEMMKMQPVSEVALPAGGKAELKPGGHHLMLFGLKTQPAENDSIFLTLYFKDETTRIAKVFVRKAAPDMPATQSGMKE